MRVNGKMIRLTVMEGTFILMERCMKASGRKINNMEMEWKHGLMVLSIEGTMLRERRTVMESSCGQMDQHMKEHFQTTISMVEEFMCGLIKDVMKVNGSTIRCMDEVFLLGAMGVSMKENISMIRNKEKECSHGLMEGNMMESGSMVSSMGKVFIILLNRM